MRGSISIWIGGHTSRKTGKRNFGVSFFTHCDGSAEVLPAATTCWFQLMVWRPSIWVRGMKEELGV